jgi:hypothetical protein
MEPPLGQGNREDPPYLEKAVSMLPGWPGYRTRLERSGLDYLDSEFELAHMEGVFLRRLFTGQLRTSARLFLTMGILGGLCLAPAASALVFPPWDITGWCYFLPLAAGAPLS